MKKFYFINDNYVIGTIKARGLTVSEFCREMNISRARFYEIMNKGWESKRSNSVQRIVDYLELDEALLWVE